ncbi:MAG: cysteine--tRNA ligase [Pseudomonadota bacterium]
MSLYLYNTLTRQKEIFKPIAAKNVKMYVCGPTVYDRAHLGNARSVVTYDVLYRLLRYIYGADNVKYVRNITDVDDKINKSAKEQGISIQQLTEKVTNWFHDDMGQLNNLRPTLEPKATEHIKQMIDMINLLIKNDKAYISEGHVLISVKNIENYGILSGRIQEDLESGARVKVESYKKAANDFVLWKPADAEDDISSVFDSPWGKGRPGWHIECSAMSVNYLGTDFDIHGGGSDLMFPHHENEIAQSCGAYPKAKFAHYWVHNGFLTVNGEKMSKSLGNFITVKDLLDKGINGEVIRYALLKTRYSEPLNWNEKLVEDAKKELDSLYRKIASCEPQIVEKSDFNLALFDDLNFPKALSILHSAKPEELRNFGELLGILQQNPDEWFKGTISSENAWIDELVEKRVLAKKSKNWAESDKIRNELKDKGIIVEDKPDGTSNWRKG